MVRKPFVALSLAMAALTALALTMLFTAPGLSANDGDTSPVPQQQELTYHNLGSHLDAVVASYESGRQSESQAAEQGELSQNGSIAVYIILNGNTAAAVDFLNDNGASVRNVSENYIEAYIPVGLLGAASQQDGVIRVRQITPPSSDYGPTTSQGVALHKANVWHTAGYTGSGVKVGILDRFDRWQELQDKGELPSPAAVRCYADIGQLSNDFDQCAQRRGSRSQHGTAAAEAVTDIAPGVSLYLANPTGSADHLETVKWMAAQGVQVISNSRGSNTFIGPGDGTTPRPLSWYDSVDEAASSGIIWVNSAGNDAAGVRWYGNYSDSNQDNIHEWGGTGGTDNDQTIYMKKDAETDIDLRWEDQWGGATRDLDVLIYSRGDRNTPLTAPVATGGQDRQNGGPGDWPVEQLEFTAPADGWYEIEVKLISGTAPSWLQLGVDNDDIELEYHFPHHSISAPANSANPGMMAVGATHHWETDTIASYSSQGPTIAGQTTQERIKPEITGVSCASSVAYNGSFCGTSGAAPHVAALAALVAEQYPRFSPAQIADYLKANAAPRLEATPNNTVPNNVWGHGFAQLPAPPDCVDNLTADGATTGTWASDCQSHVASPDPADAADSTSYARYYTFTTTEQKTVTISLDSSVDAYLYLRSGDAKSGTPVAENDDKVSGNTNSEISQSLAAGTYTIEATTYKAATAGDFTLTLSGLGGTGGGTPPPASDSCPAAATALTADGANSGTWDNTCVSQVASPDSSDAADAKGYARYYTLTPAEAREVTITLESTEDTYLYLRQGADVRTGAAVAENDDIVSGNTNSRVTATLAANTAYTVEATTYRAATAGSFTLTLAGLSDSGGGTPPPAADPCPAAATNLTADSVNAGAWDNTCVSLEGSPDTTDGADAKSYAAYYTFTAKDDEVTITLESAQDTYLYLREGDDVRTGAAAATNDDIDTAARNYNSRITETLTAGTTYTIEATTYKAATEGSFTLTISGLGTPPPPACAVGDTLTPGQSCAGQDFTAMVESNGDLLLRFSGTTAPPSGLSFTRSGNDWTVAGLP